LCCFLNVATFQAVAAVQRISIPFKVSIHNSILIFLFFFLHNDKKINILDQLRKRTKKKEEELKN
jgi:hypothetical protein